MDNIKTLGHDDLQWSNIYISRERWKYRINWWYYDAFGAMNNDIENKIREMFGHSWFNAFLVQSTLIDEVLLVLDVHVQMFPSILISTTTLWHCR